MKLTSMLIVFCLTLIVRSTDAAVALRTIYSTPTNTTFCTDAEFDSLTTHKAQRRNLRQSRDLPCSINSKCAQMCQAYPPKQCWIYYPYCYPCRRRLEEWKDQQRELFDFETSCNDAIADAEADIGIVYNTLSTTCQAHVDTRKHECFTMQTANSAAADDIHSFKLWDADIDEVVNNNLIDGDSFCENEFNFSIEAVVGDSVGYVKFELYGPNGFNYNHIAFGFPYTLFQSNGNQVSGKMVVGGEYNLVAIPDGRKSKALTLRFFVQSSTHSGCQTPAPTPSPTKAPTVAPTPSPQSFTNWIETFDQPNGSKSSSTWTVTSSDGNFYVQNGEMMVDGGGSVAELITSEFDITGAMVNVSLDLYSVGQLESDQDYVELYKIVDGGVQQLIGKRWGIQNQGTKITDTGITGNTLKLYIRTYASYSGEYYYLDNLSIIGESSVPSPPSSPTTPSPNTVPTLAPTTTVDNCKIEGWRLWDAKKDNVEDQSFRNGDKFEEEEDVAFEVIATHPDCQSMYFRLTGPSFSIPVEKTETNPLWLSFGKSGSNIYGHKFYEKGDHTIIAKPNGKDDNMQQITFKVTSGDDSDD